MNPLIRQILKDPALQPWWNRPLWGSKSGLQIILEPFFKSTIPEGALLFHQQQIAQATEIAKKAGKIDSEKFSSQEFVLFLNIRLNCIKRLADYREIDIGFKLLTAAIDVQSSFTTIWQVEYQYRSFKQMEYYKFVDSCLELGIGKEDFLQTINSKLDEILPHIKGEAGPLALKSHQKSLMTVADNEFGLELLRRFRKNHLDDYLVLQKIGYLINEVQKQDLTDLRNFQPIIVRKYSLLEKILPIIEFDPEKSDFETLVKIVQLVALEFKHRYSYQLFQQLISRLKQWYPHYREVHQICQTYTADKYRQPKEFMQKVPGSSLYMKYEQWFEDKLLA